jgi:fucose permease
MLNMGILNGAMGPLLVEISGFYKLELARVGLPVLFDGSGFLLATIIFSFIWRIHRARLILSLSSLALLIILVSIAPLHHAFDVFCVLLFLMGFSFGFLSVGLDSLFSEIYRENRAKYLNILHFFFGVGSFFGPLLAVAILRWTDKWFVFYFLVGLCHTPMILFFPKKRNYEFNSYLDQTDLPDHLARAKHPLRSGILWAIILAMFLHLGMEVSFSAWIPLFLTNIRHMSITTASYSVSLFWLAFLVGRGLYARLSHRIDLSLSLIVGASGAAVFMGLTFLGRDTLFVLLCSGCAGLFLSIVYPNVLALGASIFPNHIGFVMATLSASGGVGFMFFPWIIGPVSQYLGLIKGVFLIPMLGFAMAGILTFLRNSESNRTQAKDVPPPKRTDQDTGPGLRPTAQS